MIEPLPKPAAAAGARQLVLGTLHRDSLPIYVREETLEQIIDYSERAAGREIGGFLLGGVHVDRSEYIEIRHFVPAFEARSRAASMTFTHDTWAHLTRGVAEHFPDDVVVGWHHTHPNLGVFLSAYDLFIHRHFFREPWQVAMVVDPHRHEFGFFQWRQHDVVDCGFICVGAAGAANS